MLEILEQPILEVIVAPKARAHDILPMALGYFRYLFGLFGCFYCLFVVEYRILLHDDR